MPNFRSKGIMDQKLESSKSSKFRPLGEVLLAKGQIRKYQLEFILQIQAGYKFLKQEFPLGQLLLKHRVINEVTLYEALKVQEEMPFESITKVLDAYENQVSRLTRLIPAGA